MIKPDGTYEFDEKEISKTLIDTHVKRTTSSTVDFNEDFYNEIDETITNSIETEKHSLQSSVLDNSEPYNVDMSRIDVKASYRCPDNIHSI